MKSDEFIRNHNRFSYDLQTEVKAPFNPSNFKKDRSPEVIGFIEPEIQAKELLPSSLDMLIKVPGKNIALPKVYADNNVIRRFVEIAIAAESELLPEWKDHYYLYLTVDHRDVPAGSTHRNSGWHFDGMQGERYPQKLPICHQYVMSDCLSTEYLTKKVDLNGLCEKSQNWFSEIERQAALLSSSNIKKYAPGTVLLMTAYQIHRGAVAETQTRRLFLRLDVSMKQQDRLGNSIKPLLPPEWPMVRREFKLHGSVIYAGWDNPK
jgi:hypothetical protein